MDVDGPSSPAPLRTLGSFLLCSAIGTFTAQEIVLRLIVLEVEKVPKLEHKLHLLLADRFPLAFLSATPFSAGWLPMIGAR